MLSQSVVVFRPAVRARDLFKVQTQSYRLTLQPTLQKSQLLVGPIAQPRHFRVVNQLLESSNYFDFHFARYVNSKSKLESAH